MGSFRLCGAPGRIRTSDHLAGNLVVGIPPNWQQVVASDKAENPSRIALEMLASRLLAFLIIFLTRTPVAFCSTEHTHAGLIPAKIRQIPNTFDRLRPSLSNALRAHQQPGLP